jgi:hypothetical protein
MPCAVWGVVWWHSVQGIRHAVLFVGHKMAAGWVWGLWCAVLTAAGQDVSRVGFHVGCWHQVICSAVWGLWCAMLLAAEWGGVGLNVGCWQWGVGQLHRLVRVSVGRKASGVWRGHMCEPWWGHIARLGLQDTVCVGDLPEVIGVQ